MKSLIFKFRKHIAKNFGVEIKKTHPPYLNESINLDKGAIFVAIPKTGTTSVRKQLSQKGEPIINHPHLDIIQIRKLIYIHCLNKALGQNHTFPNKNQITNSDINFNTDQLFNSLFKFSAVRNPWARAVSLYYRNEGVKVKDKISFDDFIFQHKYACDTSVHPTFHKNQVDWLLDENNKIIIDYFYKIENFQSAISEIYELSKGKIDLINLIENKNIHSKSKDYQKLYNSKTRSFISKHFEKDIDYFKYTF